jgi:transcription initiation protein SPT3
MLEKAAAKGRKSMVKLPWELLTPFSEFLRGVPGKQNREDDEDEDEDEMQAHQDSMQRLRVSRTWDRWERSIVFFPLPPRVR